MKILLADDSVTAQNMGKKILSEAGHEVTCVSNGAAALKKASEQEPDLVILDIYMPGYSGLEVCQRLKENPATAGLPIVLTVGKLEPFRKEDAQRARAEALIVKPFEASELAAAVARFGEIAAAQAPKAKSRGKLGPQVKPKPQWEEAPEEDFVTTTRKLEEQEETAPRAAETFSQTAAEKAEEPVMPSLEPEPKAATSEFAVSPGEAAAEFPSAAQASAGTGEAFSREREAETTESSWSASAPAEFSVQESVTAGASTRPEIPPGPVAKSAAAAAGAQAGRWEGIPEFPTAGSPAQEFPVAAAHLEATAPEPPTFASPTGAEAASLPTAPEMASAVAPELPAAGAKPVMAPGVDPAFDPDRTQWATAFPTHFGVAEEETIEPAVVEEPQAAPSTSPDEIAAILSNLPGGMTSPEKPTQSEEAGSSGQRPWPVDASAAGKEAWKAEEVPVEDRDSSISLAEEMDKAQATGGETNGQPSFSQTAESASGEEAKPAAPIINGQETDHLQPTAAMEIRPPSLTEETSAATTEAIGAEPAGTEVVPEVRQAPPAPDRIAGVMQSAAMAIATRATVSAVASQLHAQPAATEIPSTGPSAIEELVGQVLERLKPKLIAEIKRELETTEEK